MNKVTNFTYPFERIGIYGVGLLGGSLGMAIKRRWPKAHVTGIGRSVHRLAEAVRRNAIDAFTCDPNTISRSLDFLVICTPVRVVHEHFEHTLPAMRDGALITDVGSAKADIVRRCEAIAGARCRFVGSHPMAGSHQTGIEAARADLFEERVCVLTPTARTDSFACDQVASFWEDIGMRVVSMPPEQHDRLTARSSHLPHLAASALCQVARRQGDAIRPVIGKGFDDSTRIAAGDSGLWVDICVDNRAEILQALREYRDEVDLLINALENNNEDALYVFLEAAQTWKEELRKI